MAVTTPIRCREAGRNAGTSLRKDERGARARFGKRTLPVDVERFESATKCVRLRPVARRAET